MVATPKISGPDGVLRENTIFSTTMSSRFFTGSIDSSTIDMQISIRGGAFTSDPDLIVFEGDTFSFPNPSAFPEGLELAPGVNRIEVRSISFSGAVSAVATVEVTLVQEADIGLIGSAPSNISVEQFKDAINIRVEGLPDATFQGVNFYASRFQGGGSTGYQRINVNAITDFEVVQETTSIANLTVESPIATNPDGTPAADPLFVKIQETQTSNPDVIEDLKDLTLTSELAAAITEQEQASLLRTDFVKTYEVPENTTTIVSNYSVSSLEERAFYTFTHNRQFGPSNDPPTVPIGEFASTPLTEPLYYVATALFFDSERQIEIESAFSAEVVGKPIVIQENIGTFPAPSRLTIVQNTIDAITRTNPSVAVQPGATIRDIVVDPTANEVVRLRFLVDFMYRIQSFDTLLHIDGIEANDEPTPVARSPYKQALQRVFDIQNSNDVQTIIDAAFEQLASRNNVFRKAGTRARGFATFFTRSTPTATIFIPLGTRIASGSIQFVTTTDASIPINNVGAFFNPTTGFFQVDVPIEADQPGTAANLGAGQIRTIVSSLPGLSVTNSNPTFGGTNQETNLNLSVRARAALAAVDTGTAQGTLQVVADVAGVQEAKVVSAGDALMQRDFDEEYNKHVGGKVDVWVKGDAVGTVTDVFAFTFETATDIQFQVIGNPLSYTFRALDLNLTPENPIAEMLDDIGLGLGLRNATTGAFFNLTNVSILDYNTIQLDPESAQPTIAFGNIILGDYRYATTTDFVLPRQPVNSILSVTGQVSGELPEDTYSLHKLDDPLLDGRSSRAKAFLRISQTNGVPSGDFIDVTNEQHVLLGEFNEFLFNLGANPLTIKVYNTDRTVLYRGPEDPSGISDYVVTPGTQTVATSIRRTPNSQIRSGEAVLIDYSHTENFTVEYVTNFVIPTVQNALDEQKHLTADVLAKEAVPVGVDVTATIVTRSGQTTSSVDTAIRTNLTTFFRALGQGGAIRQSDIITVLDNTRGVSYVATPLTKLSRSASGLVVREEVPSEAGDTQVILGTTAIPYSTDTVKTWLLNNPLNNPTSTGGGDNTQFAGVFKDDRPMILQTTDPAALKNEAGKAYIIGNEGLVIPNFSDDDTIRANFPAANTAAEIESIRRDLTANRVLVSLAADDRPDLHKFTVTYTVAFVNTRVQDIEASSIEFFEVGNLTLTFTEDLRNG